MLERNRTPADSREVIKSSKHLVTSLLFGGALLLLSHAAPAAPVVNSFNYSFRVAMTNAGLDPDARATAKGNLIRRGSKDIQRLTMSASRLVPESTYHVVAVTGESDEAMDAVDFITNRRGGSTITYHKNPGNPPHPLPEVMDPLSNLRELGILNADWQAVLMADLLSPSAFSYSVRREMENTGFIENVSGVLQLRGSPRVTRVSITATGLTPFTSYQLLVNGVSVTTKTSNGRGKLTVAGPKTGLPLVLDITTVALADAGDNLILVTAGLGIPGVLSTSKGAVVLGAAADYAVLAGSTVTSINATTVNGDLGVWAGTDVTGFAGIVPGGPGIVNGTIHAGDVAAQIAQGNLTTAYNDAAGRTLAPVDVANADLGGRTLAPGLYKSSGTLAVTGTLTLDASGDANAVWIFQIASSLNTASGSQVILSGGAKAANIYWQVGSSATLGTTTAFKGTIMSDQSISLATGVTLNGRALARIGAVTMDANIITIPAP
jgi:hypothetical protein